MIIQTKFAKQLGQVNDTKQVKVKNCCWAVFSQAFLAN